jgi:pimeloyl-ACP methyl ester carboxylesterase
MAGSTPLQTESKTSASVMVVASAIPYRDFGGSGQPLHFLHANGYPPECYRPLLDRLATRHHVLGMLLRPLWPDSDPASLRDWQPLSDDLREFLGAQSASEVIGMGHSIGAVVTLRAALKEPGRFRALVLIDPVLLPRKRVLQLRFLRTFRLARRMNARVDAALRRRRRFDDLDQLFAGYRRRDIFRHFSDEYLRALVDGITRPSPHGGYELTYSPEWEARIYETGIWNDLDLWAGLPKLRVPTLIVRGAETDTFWESTGKLVRQSNPAIEVVTIPLATHLVPLERPDKVFEAMQGFLGKQG